MAIRRPPTTFSDTISTADIADDAISGDKLANDIAISTTGNITTTGSGALTVAGNTTLSGTNNLGSNPTITLGSNANFDSIADDAISGDKLNGGSPSFASLSVADAISTLGTASKFLKTNSDGGLAHVHTKRGYVSTSNPGTVNIHTPSTRELGMVFAWKRDDSTAQACSLYSAEYPGNYALRVVNLGNNNISISYFSSVALSVTSSGPFQWAVLSMYIKQ